MGLLFVLGCRHDVPDIIPNKTQFIMHRGGGSDQNSESNLRENTVAACYFGFENLDGIEIDIQRTNDYEVFLEHDELIDKCGRFDIKSVAASTVPKVMEQYNCLFPEDSISRLSEVLKVQREFSHKALFLDVKAVATLQTILKMPTPQEYLNLMSQDLFKLIENHPYPHNIHIETENAVMLNAFKRHHPSVNTWLAGFDNINNAVNKAFTEHYTGVSINDGDYITKESVQNAHSKGLKVSVWVVNDSARQSELIDMQVDYIQTDKPRF